MRMQEAEKLMSPELSGYQVRFEAGTAVGFRTDYFPEVKSGEEPIATEQEAWGLAYRFARYNPKYMNVYVVHAGTGIPVEGYRERMLNCNRG